MTIRIGDPPISATPTQVAQIRADLSVGGIEVALVPNAQGATATANTAALQAALNNKGSVNITVPGLYYVNSMMSVPSNTTLHIGAGVELRMDTNSNTGMFINANARATGLSIAGGAATWVNVNLDGNLMAGMRVTLSGINTTYPVGSVVAVAGTSVGEWIGVWEVANAVAGSPGYIEFLTDSPPSNGANPSARSSPSALPMLLYPADENITICGQGTINGNGANQSGTANVEGHPLGNVIWTRNARNVLIDGPNFSRGKTWTIGSSNVSNYIVRNCTGNTLTAGALTSDFVHLAGAHRNALVENISASSEDNVVGLTIDVPTLSSFQDFPYYDAGDQINVTLRNIRGVSPKAIVGVYGPAQYKYRNLLIDGVTGRGSAAIQCAVYVPTNMLQVTVQSAVFKNIYAFTPGPPIQFLGGFVWDHLTIDDVTMADGSAASVVAFVQSSGETATFQQLAIKNLRYTVPGYGMLESVIRIEGTTLGTTNIGALTVSDCETFNLAANYSFVRRSNLGTITKATYERIKVVSTASTTGALHKDVAGCGPTTEVVFNNCSYTSVSQTGSMYDQGSSVTTGTVRFRGCVISGAASFINAANATPTINVVMENVALGSVQCARAGVFTGPTNLFVSGYSEGTAPVNNPFQCVTAAKAYNFRFENIGRDADSIQKTAGDLRFHGGGARTAIANVNTPAVGDMVYNITGTVRVARNIANSAWVNLHT
jgi:hypothetical protein